MVGKLQRIHCQSHLYFAGIAAERKEAKQEKDEAEKYKKLHEDYTLIRMQLMLFKLFYCDKEMEAIRAETEVKFKRFHGEIQIQFLVVQIFCIKVL